MAIALVEDLEHMRIVLEHQELSTADIRRLGALMRRILVDCDGDLRRVAPPRTGRINIYAPDTKDVVKSIDKDPALLASIGKSKVLGLETDFFLFDKPKFMRALVNYNPDKIISLSQDGFLSQKVIYFRETWATRRDVIKFVANTTGSVHSHAPSNRAEIMLKQMRHAAAIAKSTDSDGYSLFLQLESTVESEKPFSVGNSSRIDLVMLQFVSAIQYLLKSPDIISLENYVKSEGFE